MFYYVSSVTDVFNTTAIHAASRCVCRLP